MKILQLITADQLRGAEMFAARLSGQLAERGHEVVLAHLYASSGAVLPTEAGVDRMDLGGTPIRGLSLTLAFRLARCLRDFHPDVIQANGSDTLKYAVVARWLARSSAVLVYRNISMISHWTSDRWRRRWVCGFMRRVDCVVSVSEASRRDMVASCGLPASRVVALARGVPVPPAVDRAQACACLRALVPGLDDERLLFHVGSHTLEKNHRGLLEIFGAVRAQVPDVRLIIVGTGPLTSTIESWIDEAGLREWVHLLGARNDVADLMPAADLVLLPSHVEGIPGVILEAGAAEVPAVAYGVGGVGEVVKTGVTGIVTPYGDSAAFSAAVIRLLADSEARRQMGRRAREYVLASHSLEVSSERFERLYEELLAGGPAEGPLNRSGVR